MTIIHLIGKGNLTTKEGTSFPLNFNIQNLLDINSIPSSYSKNIIIPGTKDNNKLLGSLFSINYSNGNFNPYNVVKCAVYQDGIPVFNNATLQLISFEKKGGGTYKESDYFEYTVRVTSELTNFFNIIKNKTFKDIDFSKEDRWGTKYITDIPIIQKNINELNLLYKYLYYYTQGNTLSLQDAIPSLMLKTIIDRIHDEAGFDYNMVNKDEFRYNNLILPAHTKFKENANTNRLASFINNFVAYTNTFSNVNSHSSKVRAADSRVTNRVEIKENQGTPNTPSFRQFGVQNFNNNYNYTLHEYTAFLDTKHRIKLDYDYYVSFDNDALLNEIGPGFQMVYYSNNNAIDGIYFAQVKGTIHSYVNGVEESELATHYSELINVYMLGQPGSPTYYTVRYPGNRRGVSNTEHEVELNKGDKLTLEYSTKILLYNLNGELITSGSDVMQLDAAHEIGVHQRDIKASIRFFQLNTSITPSITSHVDGIPLNFSSYYDDKIKQSDIIRSIVKLFNLIIYSDESGETINYETRDSYFDRGKQVDWSNKLDKSKVITVEFLRNKQKRYYNLTYKEDKDSFNTEYQDFTEKVYGQKEYDFDTNANSEVQKIDSFFSPTPIYYSTYGEGYLMGLESPLKTDTVNPRILFIDVDKDGGAKLQKTSFTYLMAIGAPHPNMEIPYVGHFDDPVNPTIDLNFEQPDYYFYDKLSKPTSNNLFNLFHRRQIQQLSDGKIMTAFFNLTPTDISEFEYNDKIYVNDSWWHVNRIIDYDANSNSVTKVELISVDDEIKLNLKSN